MPGRRVLIAGGGIAGLAVLSLRDPGSREHSPAERLPQLFAGFADPAATLLDALDAADEIHVATDNVLRVFGHRIMHADYRPLLDEP